MRAARAAVGRERRRARREAEHGVGLRADERDDRVRDEGARGVLVGDDHDFCHWCSPTQGGAHGGRRESERDDLHARREVEGGEEGRVRGPLAQDTAGPREQRVAERGEPAADHDVVDVGREHEQAHRRGDAGEEPLAHRDRAVVARIGGVEQLLRGQGAVGRPHAGDRRAGGERLEASALAAAAHHARRDRPGCARSRRRRRGRRAGGARRARCPPRVRCRG